MVGNCEDERTEIHEKVYSYEVANFHFDKKLLQYKTLKITYFEFFIFYMIISHCFIGYIWMYWMH